MGGEIRAARPDIWISAAAELGLKFESEIRAGVPKFRLELRPDIWISAADSHIRIRVVDPSRENWRPIQGNPSSEKNQPVPGILERPPI